jgi:iron complex transport system ATP-binding protein
MIPTIVRSILMNQTPRAPAGGDAAQLDGVTVRYGTLIALEEISLQVRSATSVALIGPNGSGKTTLLHLLAGLVTPAGGTVELAPEAQPVSYVVQQHGHRAWMPLTAGEVITMGRYQATGLIGRLRRADRLAIGRAAERMEIDPILHRQFGELSGGQQQRVLMAQALATEPRLLLLDEPITGLDLASQQRILTVIDEETAAGTTVVITTHHLDEARHCDEVILLASRIVASGTPDEVLTPETLHEAYAGRVLGEHDDHGHDHDLVVLDDHGHGHDLPG